MTSENIQTSQDNGTQIEEYVQRHLNVRSEGSVGAIVHSTGDEAAKVSDVSKFFEDKIRKAKASVKQDLDSLTYMEEGQDLSEYITQMQSQTTAMIHNLEKFTDLSLGIVREVSKPQDGVAFVGGDKSNKNPIIVRDARLQAKYQQSISDSDKPVAAKAEDVPETTITIAAGMLRGVLQIIKDCDGGKKTKAAKEAIGLFKKYEQKITKKERTQSKRNEILEQMNGEFRNLLKTNELSLGQNLLSKYSDEDLAKGMGYVRDLTNLLDDEQSTIITLTDIGSSKTHISASTPFKPLSQELELYYNPDQLGQVIKGLNPIFAHSLTRGGFVDKVMDGQHMIPSQLHLPGLRNAYEERSFVVGDDVTEAKRVMSRSATIADKNGKGDSKVSMANARHMKQVSGGDKVVLEVNVLNSNVSDMFRGERTIVQEVRSAFEDSGVKDTEVTLRGISTHDSDKAKHVSEISDGAKAAAETIKPGNTGTVRRQFLTCKSGKDRTNAAVTIVTLESLEEVKDVDLNVAQTRVAMAGHGSALSAAHGATAGINGTKMGNVLNGLSEKNCVLVKFNKYFVTKVADANHVKCKSKNNSYLKLIREADDIAQTTKQMLPPQTPQARLVRRLNQGKLPSKNPYRSQ